MAPGVAKTFIKELYRVLCIRYPECCGDNCALVKGEHLTNEGIKDRMKKIREADKAGLIFNHLDEVREMLRNEYCKTLNDIEIESCINIAKRFSDDATHQAMEAVVHNLNSMHSRAGRI